MAYSERKAPKATQKQADSKIKRFEGDKGDGKGKYDQPKIKDSKQEEESSSKDTRRPCKFYLTESGCKQGRNCKWGHVPDGTRRCHNCGGSNHISPNCPYKDGGPKVKATGLNGGEKSRTEAESASPGKEEQSSEASEGDKMKQLLEEANDMLRGFNKKASAQAGPTLEQLQAQLDELKKKSMKTLRLTRRHAEEKPKYGLLDSGAANPLRPLRADEDLTQLERVWVALADGQKTPTLINKRGVMISTNLNIEPIVPMGWLTAHGCGLKWSEKALVLRHPVRGGLQVSVEMGCPQVKRELAMELIHEFEVGSIKAKSTKVHESPEESLTEEDRGLQLWMQKVVLEDHPVLSVLPEHVKSGLVVPSGHLKNLPANRHQRKRLQREGYILHLFAGVAEGFALHKAFQEAGVGKRLLEVDLKRGESHDMLGDTLYPALLRAAISGHLLGVIGGPNCRTRSVLRHYPKQGAPRPIRSWQDGQEYGLKELADHERSALHDDDLMLWRMLFIYVIAEMVTQATRPGEKCHLLLEQTAAPDNVPECVSFWKTREWEHFADVHGLHEQTFNQGDYVYGEEAAVKPTTAGGTLVLEMPTRKNPMAKSTHQGDGDSKSDSKSLARWNAGFNWAITKACVEQVLSTRYQIKQLSWKQHVECGHVPLWRDCRVCQESSAKARPHRSVPNPICGVLSLDITGPLIQSRVDMSEEKMRYILVGAFTSMDQATGCRSSKGAEASRSRRR